MLLGSSRLWSVGAMLPISPVFGPVTPCIPASRLARRIYALTELRRLVYMNVSAFMRPTSHSCRDFPRIQRPHL
ncbi:hypothetical protein B0H11DRAFT_1380239 [Mycena galericulata]|nr:hypothetical protein B0H11DRAFT_1380239 [Mycena galericulata]